MPVADDWDIDYANKVISHIDGVLNWDGRTAGTSPAVGTFVRGATSGAIAKILSGDTGVTSASGSFNVTNVVGFWQDGESFSVLSEVPFDGLTANGGWVDGDVLDDGATASITVRFTEFNLGATGGEGTIYGDSFTAGFANNDNIELGATIVALVNGTEVDNSGTTWDAVTNQPSGGISVPGTANTNNSVTIYYDGGSVPIPEGAKISDTTTGAEGFAQQVLGTTTSGSIRLVDSNTTGGAWTDNNGIDLEDVVFYNAQVAGQVFQVGDIIEGQTSTEQFRVLAIVDDGDSTGKLITAGKTGAVTAAEDLSVIRRGGNPQTAVKIAEAENTTTVLAAATLNIPSGVRDEQRTTQGGIYAAGSLNVVRSWNELFTYTVDTFDELAQMDDEPPLTANVKDQVYVGANDWKIPDLSMRFLESGSYQDQTGDNIFTNLQSLAQAPTIGDHGYFYDATNPTPQPNLYVEQNGSVLRQDWLEGNINVLVKTRTNTDVTVVDSTVPALGQNINGGSLTTFMREYTNTYDHFSTTAIGGVAVVPLSTAVDADNQTGTNRNAYTGGSGLPFTVGEEIIGGTSGAIGIVTASDSGATGNVDYVLKTTVDFSGAETITGQVSGGTAVEGTPSDLVAGYDADIKIMTVDRDFTGGTSSGTWVYGETVTQTGSGATGFILEDDANTLYMQDATGTFNGTGLLTGGISGVTYTPTATATASTVPKAIDGATDANYTAVIVADITNANPRTIADVYEWAKFVTRSEEATLLQGGPGTAEAGVQGRIYIELVSTFAEVKASPYGTFAGGTMFGAQGVFIDKDTLVAADIQKIQLIDNAGNTLNPPNLQAMQVTNLVSPDTVAVYRTTGVSSTTILRNEFDVGTVGAGNNQSGDSTILIGDNTRTGVPTPNDVPDTGVLRVLDPNGTGNYLRFPYSSVDRTTGIFTLASGTIGAVTGSQDLILDDNVHVVFIEEDAASGTASNTVENLSDIPLLIRVREKGILPFETTGTFGSTGSNTGAVRTADPIVNLP